jgi:tRNA (cmo5U34)-methyltransferase
MGGQFHLDADTFLAMTREEIPNYDELQAALAQATTGSPVRSILDLGCGTGETAIATLGQHPEADLVGVDSSDDMLSIARQRLSSATFISSRLQDPLPHGPFDVVVSAFAIHHLDAGEKASLFRRVKDVMSPGGRFVMLDVVVPTEPVDSPIRLEEGVDKPSSVGEMLQWMDEAGLRSEIVHGKDDLAILKATAQLWHCLRRDDDA